MWNRKRRERQNERRRRRQASSEFKLWGHECYDDTVVTRSHNITWSRISAHVFFGGWRWFTGDLRDFITLKSLQNRFRTGRIHSDKRPPQEKRHSVLRVVRDDFLRWINGFSSHVSDGNVWMTASGVTSAGFLHLSLSLISHFTVF